MCGRYIVMDPDFINSRYDLEYPLLNVPANYNVAPGAEMPTVTRKQRNEGMLRKWGLVPFWAKDPGIGYKMINARAETVSTKASFRKPIRTQRCLVPASGFYEWKKEGGQKIPYLFVPAADEVFSLAGLYDLWKGPDGTLLPTYTIITIDANELIQPIHERMPVILKREDEDRWLESGTPFPEVMRLLQPFPPEKMDFYQVSAEVNNVRNNYAKLVNPVQ